MGSRDTQQTGGAMATEGGPLPSSGASTSAGWATGLVGVGMSARG